MPKRLPERSRAWITTGGIAAVVLAGAFAVAANVGILQASSDSQIGALAAGDLVPSTSTADASGTADTAPAPSTVSTEQTYVVDNAGTVTVGIAEQAIALRAVGVEAGWRWMAGAADGRTAEVTFTDGDRLLVFTASRASDGTIDASVRETSPAAAGVPVPQHRDDDADHDEREGHDDDD